MRPYRAVVVGHGIVTYFAPRERADAPAGIERRRKQLLGHTAGALARGKTGKEKMAGIGGADAAQISVTVARDRVIAEVLHPEFLLDGAAQALCAPAPARRRFAVTPPIAKPGHRAIGGKG